MKMLNLLPAVLASSVVGFFGAPSATSASAQALHEGSLLTTSADPAKARQPYQFNRQTYTPATLRLAFTSRQQTESSQADRQSFLDLSLITPQGETVGKRIEISLAEFSSLLRNLYSTISRQSDLEVANPQSPSRRLFDLLIRPLLPELESRGVTTILISADTGLQAIPFAALHDGSQYFGVRYAFSMTPSIGLMPLDVPSRDASRVRQTAMGSSTFVGLAPLPLVPQEVRQISAGSRADALLDASFTREALLSSTSSLDVSRVHVATHAEFLPGGPAKARIYTGNGSVSLAEFSSIRQRRQEQPLDLIVLSACRTALGDQDSELGFAGLALQAGARSAVGTLWYVDDVATSAFFIQFYQYLKQGMPKAEAMQATRAAFASAEVTQKADKVIGPNGQILLSGLSVAEQRRIAGGLANPYYWAGIQLMGTPW